MDVPPPRLLPYDRKIAALGYIFLCLNALFFGYLSVADSSGYDTHIKEDGWVENLTAVWLLLAGLMLLATALAETNFLRRCIYVLGSIAFVFGAGEEISWGQRILGFATPDFLLNLNTQGEFNVHNINYEIFHIIFLEGTLVLCVLTCAAFFNRKNKLFGIRLPSILLVLGFLTMLSYRGDVETDFVDFILQREQPEQLLLLLIAIFTLFSRQTKLFVVAATTMALVVALACANYFHGPYVNEVREYLFSSLFLFYTLQLFLAHEPVRRKLMTQFTSFSLLLRRVEPWHGGDAEADFSPPDTGSIENLMQTLFLVACIAIIATSIVLASFAYFSGKAEVAAFEERYRKIISIKPDIKSSFDVYLTGKELIYFKAPCVPADTESRFFLHIIPADKKSLPSDRKRYGFDNLDFAFKRYRIPIKGEVCAAVRELPDYAIAAIHTGQYTDEGQIWKGSFEVVEPGG